MNTPTLLLPLTLLAALPLAAQSPNATGVVEGRVTSAATGEPLELARVTVEGTAG